MIAIKADGDLLMHVMVALEPLTSYLDEDLDFSPLSLSNATPSSSLRKPLAQFDFS